MPNKCIFKIFQFRMWNATRRRASIQSTSNNEEMYKYKIHNAQVWCHSNAFIVKLMNMFVNAIKVHDRGNRILHYRNYNKPFRSRIPTSIIIIILCIWLNSFNHMKQHHLHWQRTAVFIFVWNVFELRIFKQCHCWLRCLVFEFSFHYYCSECSWHSFSGCNICIRSSEEKN